MSVQEYLESYNGTHPFLLSVKEQLQENGSISDRQAEAVSKFMANDRSATHELVGKTIEIKAWLAKSLSTEKNIQMFRNIVVNQVVRETPKAYLIRAKLAAKPAVNCHVCGRDLDNEISIATGIGPVCAEKIGFERNLDKYQLLTAIQELVEKTGIIELWLPKSQIKEVIGDDNKGGVK